MEFGETIIVTWSLNEDLLGDGIANENVRTDSSSRLQ
jgi:hypothetical protein